MTWPKLEPPTSPKPVTWQLTQSSKPVLPPSTMVFQACAWTVFFQNAIAGLWQLAQAASPTNEARSGGAGGGGDGLSSGSPRPPSDPAVRMAVASAGSRGSARRNGIS